MSTVSTNDQLSVWGISDDVDPIPPPPPRVPSRSLRQRKVNGSRITQPVSSTRNHPVPSLPSKSKMSNGITIGNGRNGTNHRTPNELQRNRLPLHSQSRDSSLPNVPSQCQSQSHSQSLHSHSRPSPSTASTVSPQIPLPSGPSSHALDHEGFRIPSHSLSSSMSSRRLNSTDSNSNAPNTCNVPSNTSKFSKPTPGGQPVLCTQTGSGSNTKSMGNKPVSGHRSLATNAPNTNRTKSDSKSTLKSQTQSISSSQSSFDWLRRVNSSRVLNRNEIESVVNHSMLTGYDREVAEKRVASLSARTHLQHTRQWAGLCKYDDPDRIEQVVKELNVEKSSLTQKLMQLLKKNKNCKSEEETKRQEMFVEENKAMISLLTEYRDAIKRARVRLQLDSGNANNSNSGPSTNHGHKSMNHSSGNLHPQHSRNNHGHRVSSKPILAPHSNSNSNGMMGPHGHLQSAIAPSFYAFGRSADKFDYSLNPEFCAAFRGHMMSHDEFEHFSALRAIEHDDTTSNEGGTGSGSGGGGDIGMMDHNNCNVDTSTAVQLRSNQSLLGAASHAPPSIDVINIFRDKTNEHQKTLVENLKTLYGDDWRKYVGSDGKYTAHLLSQYQMDKLLGNGVYGHVFKAKTKNTNHTVAIKALQLVCTGKQKQIQDDHQRKLREHDRNDICPYIMNECIPVPVIREIMCLKMMNHENITKLYDIVLNDPMQCASLSPDDPLRSVTTVEYNKRDTQSTQWNLHLVQEYVPNELYKTYQNLLCLHLEESHHLPEFKGINIKTLTPKMMPKQNGKWFSCASIKSVIQDILKGLEYLSRISYVHRDMKPANLLMTDDGIVKIADFGLSRPKYKPNELLTNNHNVVTRYYRAPEILVEQDKKVSAYGFASDMWSAGAIFAELIYSRPIFEGSSDMTMIFEIIKKCGGISEATWPGISSVLTHDPPANFVRIDPKTKKPRRWEEGEQKFNFFRNLKPEFRNSPRKMADILKPWIHHSWTAENVRQGLDLLDKMLCYSPKHRITPTEALKHPWFTMSPKPDPKEMKALIARAKTYRRKSRTPQPNMAAANNRGHHGHHQHGHGHPPKHGHHGPNHRGLPNHGGHPPPHHHRNARPLPHHGSHSNHNHSNNRHHNGYNNNNSNNNNSYNNNNRQRPPSHNNSHHGRSGYHHGNGQHHRRGGPDHQSRGYRDQRGGSGPASSSRGGRGPSGNGMRMNSNPSGNGQRGSGMSSRNCRKRRDRRSDSTTTSVSVSSHSASSGPKYHGPHSNHSHGHSHGHGHHPRNGYHSQHHGQKRNFNQSHSGHYTSSGHGHPAKKRRMN